MFICEVVVSLLFVGSVIGRPVRQGSIKRASAKAQAAATVAPAGWQGQSSFKAAGTSGVSAMQLAVVDDNSVLIFDKQENNPLKVKGQSVWGSVYSLDTAAIRPLSMETNSFCAGGGWLSNGTMVSVGGSPLTSESEEESEETVAGWDGLRMFTPGKTGAEVYEDPSRLRLTSERWYPSTTRLEDGSLIIFGGMEVEGFTNNNAADNNPTLEFWPPKFDGRAIHSQFLVDALNTNLFPVTFLLPTGDIFVAANTLAMTYNWKTNKETRFPPLPNGVRINYPASAASALLPLTIANDWTPEVLLCGGSSAASIETGKGLSALSPASAQCSRMVLDKAGIAAGWATETMPEERIMGDAVLTPDGQVLLINGAGTGQAGFSNVKDGSAIGQSNARNPVFRPTLYSPSAARGARFSTNFPSSKIERLYHSSASVIPDGRLIVAGSNPNNDVVTDVAYVTRYEVELFSPPYLAKERPAYTGVPTNLAYGASFTLDVTLPANTSTVQAVVMDLGYSTHGLHMSQRWVELVATLKRHRTRRLGPRKRWPVPAWAWVAPHPGRRDPEPGEEGNGGRRGGPAGLGGCFPGDAGECDAVSEVDAHTPARPRLPLRTAPPTRLPSPHSLRSAIDTSRQPAVATTMPVVPAHPTPHSHCKDTFSRPRPLRNLGSVPLLGGCATELGQGE